MNEIEFQRRLLAEGIAAAKAVRREQRSRWHQAQTSIHRIEGALVAKRAQARQALLRVVELDETNVSAWLWLSTVVEDQTEKFTCLENVLALDPANRTAQAGLLRLGISATTLPTPESSSSISPVSRSMPDQGRARPRPVAQVACPFCRRFISAIALRCPGCSLPLVVDCPDCDTRLDVEQQGCPQCGRQLGDCRQHLSYFAGLARTYQAKQQQQKALMAWQVVEQLRPDFPDLDLHLGQTQAAVGRTRTAITYLQRSLEQDPGQLAAALALGQMFHQLHRWRDAQAIYARALVKNRASPQLHFALGWLLMEQNKLKAALPHLRKATRLDPQHGLAWWRLAQLYEQLQKARPARRAYRRASRTLPPETVAFKRVQERLQSFTPTLPLYMAWGWTELGRQGLGPVCLCLLAALLDAGLRPWWIPWTGWTAIGLATLGTFLWLSGTSLPQNALIRLLVGQQGLSSSFDRVAGALVGASCWLIGLGVILYPLNQAFPEWPL